MIPEFLHLINFQTHSDSTLDFTKLDKVTLIVGEYLDTPERSNGSGKSSVFDGISWILFDQTRVSKNKHLTTDLLIRDKQDFMSGVFVFKAKDGYRYRVSKTYKKKTGPSQTDLKLEIFNNNKWKSIARDGNRGIKKQIVEILGFDYSIYESTTYCKQHEVTGIAEADSTDRLNLIKKLLQLDIYNKHAEAAKNKRDELKQALVEVDILKDQADEAKEQIKKSKEILTIEKDKQVVIKTKIERNKQKVQEIREEINKLNRILGAIEALKNSYQQSQQRISALLEELQKQEIQLQESKLKVTSLTEEYKKKSERFTIIEQSKPDKAKLLAEFKQASSERDKIQNTIGSLEGMLSSTMEQGRSLKQEYEAFKELGVGKCPTCSHQITEEHHKQVSSVYEEKLQKLREKAIQLKTEKDKITETLIQHDKIISSLELKKEEYNALIEERNEIAERLKAVKELLQSAQQSVENCTTQKTLLQKELEEVRSTVKQNAKQIEEAGGTETNNKHETLAASLKDYNIKEEACQIDLNKSQASINTETARIVELEKIVEDYKEKSKKLEMIRSKVGILDTLYRDFSKTIPTMIIENSASLIESVVNKCLTTLSDGFLIKIITQHKNKTNNNVKEIFDIEVICNEVTRPFALLSGGEKFRVAFSIRIALSILMLQQAGIPVGAIFYDEPFNDLDEDGLSKLQEVFSYLSTIFEHQLAITHQMRLKEAFNDVICVKKGHDGSTIHML